MEFPWILAIKGLVGVGLLYLVLCSYFQKRKFANYSEFLAGKKVKLDRASYVRLVNREIAELKSEIKVREARGKKEDPKHKELLEIVEAESEKLSHNLE